MEIHDLIIVGAGPAGLSAAINGASEMNRVLLIDSGKRDAVGQHVHQLGGQIIGSTLIENYAGFPDGISGCELMSRFEAQARKLGTEIICPQRVDSIALVEGAIKRLTTKEGMEFFSRAVVLSSGLSYRKLEAPGVAELLGKGVLYGSPTYDARQLGKSTICVVGGANSAGQAIMHFSRNPDCIIKVLIRGNKPIDSQMSKYLVDRIHTCPNVQVLQNAEVAAVHGTEKLEGITLLRNGTDTEEMQVDHLFIFIGAAPKTEWLEGVVTLDPRKFIATDMALGTLYGPKLPFETSLPGVFAAGDTRFESVKRVASAVGEGSAVVSNVHQYISRLRS